jgi:hypothetical protein
MPRDVVNNDHVVYTKNMILSPIQTDAYHVTVSFCLFADCAVCIQLAW